MRRGVVGGVVDEVADRDVRRARPADAEVVARLLVDFNRESHKPSPPADVLAERLRALMAGGDTLGVLLCAQQRCPARVTGLSGAEFRLPLHHGPVRATQPLLTYLMQAGGKGWMS
jgi:hypothetical protein